ncbi:probable O-sialoglycoprotein endopeptidase protein [Fulvimarina pelagi HTCC2506]|uniref:Probable O-sialoglycoprotein endopeptidase protein n=1 Tax=Fulvimarina pelagi HTCC2506 TaxID=314231 RepID=Q0G0N4_9HYPH|nr:tRNA (adenosine(37)-N6)-threonylcarbamoyltransferase complex dimerization subunit type 1 TsaB [Fulvimarina pelagi]EAU40955.1 probable O-sialoglycoprotein endopeptidase protein [Fulvimarina pelagi HTCC2506]
MPQSGAHLILAIDTALDDCSAAVFDARANLVLGKRTERIGRGHAERLPAVIDAALAEASSEFSDIAMIAVTIGPGSFTGVRVGVAAARGYALALAIPAIGVTTLEVMAEAVRRDTPVLAVHDAKRGEVYALLMGADGEILKAPEALDPAALVDFAGAAGERLVLAGSASGIAADLFGIERTATADPTSQIDVAVVARLVAEGRSQQPVKPLYLRNADAKPPSRHFNLFAEPT